MDNVEQYKIEIDGDFVTIWDNDSIVGLRFKSGERLQLYTSELVIRSESRLASVDALTLSRANDRLTQFAIERFPDEFGEIDTTKG